MHGFTCVTTPHPRSMSNVWNVVGCPVGSPAAPADHSARRQCLRHHKGGTYIVNLPNMGGYPSASPFGSPYGSPKSAPTCQLPSSPFGRLAAHGHLRPIQVLQTLCCAQQPRMLPSAARIQFLLLSLSLDSSGGIGASILTGWFGRLRAALAGIPAVLVCVRFGKI